MTHQAWLWLTNVMWFMTLVMVLLVEQHRRAGEYYKGLIDGIDVSQGKIHLEVVRDGEIQREPVA